MSIPSIQEIESSTDFLSPSDSSTRVVRINDTFAVKYGQMISLIEADNLRYVAANSSVPVPKVLASFSEPESGVKFIVMDYIPGITLEEAWPDLQLDERSQVEERLKEILAELRRMPAEGYIGSVHHQKCEDSFFWTPNDDPSISGPFASHEQMAEGILTHLQETHSPPHIKLLRNLMSSLLLSKPHRVVFTHGDFQAKNIMFQRTTTEDGRPSFELILIDWETSGWYPEYWEFCYAASASRYRPSWLEVIMHIMPAYEVEYAMMQTLRHLFFW